MHTNVKVYRTFAEINKDLEILKIEKDLAYAKFVKGLDETKESLQPGNLIGETPKKILGVLGAFKGPIKSAVITFLLKKFF
ncbi:hypothetical protein Q765_14320 [Flavobacterium rivuli WB 3.3-2 = DSM 21788]|uniref:Uncharacterized protein n=1 Tax=Flavobacterium rivuli WB 3.3-2 = DSM 21788 TaxID=1121895 RepID=A0A0A2M2W5_9FLAO|nr:DUF6327 family protein [Flavobacterium rivuli]KGO85798.1 hypothetical protein Q765_14320 [Flavobacterium rivuli WB 3.3-2 = DSM 21788]